ncbi:MAG: anion permease [Candidatus Omnitrophica bacterium]|nr:anion permease [Candidatus Omnitrophota bacterium]
MKQFKTPLIFAGIIAVTTVVLAHVGFTAKQIISTDIFLMILCGTLFYWKFRVSFAFSGIAILLGANLLDIPHVIEFAGLDIILFLVGMMTVIGFLEENHFFEYVVAKVVDAIGEKPFVLMAVLMALSSLSAALVDEVTSILFMMSTMFHITKRYKVNPIPFLLMVVFATNIGSSATAVGNPIGVMIAMRAGLTFADFLRWAAPISIVCLIATILLCLFLFRRDIEGLKAAMDKKRGDIDELKHVHYTKTGIRTCWILFTATVACLVMHHALEEALGLQKNTLLLGTALFFGAIAILLKANEAREFFMRRVDWWTLTFFLALFASVGTLKYVGVTEQIAKGMIHIAGGGSVFLLNIFTAAICLLTGFMDNVLAVATFIPILADIQKIGVYIFPFWWAMLFGGTMYGNLTVVGSTANIVAMGMLEKESGQSIKFMEWMKPGFIVSTVTIVIAMTLLYAQFYLMPGAPATF